MKKIIAIAVAAVVMAGSSFALGLGVGGKAIIGKNVADNQPVKDAAIEALSDRNFDFGGSAYVNLSILGGLGAQLEANLINSAINFESTASEGSAPQTVKCDTLFFDIAPMVWWNVDLWKLRIGVGAGPNFSITVNSPSELATATQDMFTPGVCAGADVRFYLTDHLGLVVSARYVGEFTTKSKEIKIAEIPTGQEYPTYTANRQTLYGGIGAEFKLF
ncbi:MAG: outer membrane beta-barrel protein [Treponema sp.]|nr:outer membrane beta-barrel protein [Treponema sp.]